MVNINANTKFMSQFRLQTVFLFSLYTSIKISLYLTRSLLFSSLPLKFEILLSFSHFLDSDFYWVSFNFASFTLQSSNLEDLLFIISESLRYHSKLPSWNVSCNFHATPVVNFVVERRTRTF
ncbi:hypothetical protein NC652_035629 [Populus alba x Populus x berolinensis]|nr:hypothetical protein NC652_035629 [Populus alba x Populus x berolinensis]